jgi:hypothetical protein
LKNSIEKKKRSKDDEEVFDAGKLILEFFSYLNPPYSSYRWRHFGHLPLLFSAPFPGPGGGQPSLMESRNQRVDDMHSPQNACLRKMFISGWAT